MDRRARDHSGFAERMGHCDIEGGCMSPYFEQGLLREGFLLSRVAGPTAHGEFLREPVSNEQG